MSENKEESKGEYVPPKVWQPTDMGGKFGSINRPTAGAREEKKLPRGDHKFQLYSLATPNGVKVTVMFEELLELGVNEAEYDAYTIDIGSGDQFGSDFVELNPNSKIPVLEDRTGDKPIRVFESGHIVLHLADKFKKFVAPPGSAERVEQLNWLFWLQGSAPLLGGGFGHFYNYAPTKLEYPINRYAQETKRQLDVLDQRLAKDKFLGGDEYSIADIVTWPWYGILALGEIYSAGEFLQVDTYKNVVRWAKEIAERPAVKRGRVVNKAWGDVQLLERHSKDDFEKLEKKGLSQ